jgi:hypothetical protein
MSRYRQLSAEERAAIKLAAHQRVEAVWTCLGVLRPDLTPQAKKALAEKVFDLCRGNDRKAPRIMITPAQVESMIWSNMQCIKPNSSCLTGRPGMSPKRSMRLLRAFVPKKPWEIERNFTRKRLNLDRCV